MAFLNKANTIRLVTALTLVSASLGSVVLGDQDLPDDITKLLSKPLDNKGLEIDSITSDPRPVVTLVNPIRSSKPTDNQTAKPNKQSAGTRSVQATRVSTKVAASNVRTKRSLLSRTGRQVSTAASVRTPHPVNLKPSPLPLPTIAPSKTEVTPKPALTKVSILPQADFDIAPMELPAPPQEEVWQPVVVAAKPTSNSTGGVKMPPANDPVAEDSVIVESLDADSAPVESTVASKVSELTADIPEMPQPISEPDPIRPVPAPKTNPQPTETSDAQVAKLLPEMPDPLTTNAVAPNVPQPTAPPFARPLDPTDVNALSRPSPTFTTSMPADEVEPTPLESALVPSSPDVELAAIPDYQTLNVANSYVPESALSGTVLGSDFQNPALFSHSWSTQEHGQDVWPCNGCGQRGCECCPTRWRVRADGMLLHRSRADGFDIPLIRKFGDGTRPTIDCPPDAISMDYHGGPRLSLIRDNLCDGCDFEATYYLISQWTGSDFVNGEVAFLGFTSNGNGFAQVRYESRLQNAEANMFTNLNNWTQFMVGFRWLQFDEFARVNGSTDLIPVFDQSVSTLNNLFGGQVGLRRSIWDRGGFVTVNATAKGGVFNNHIDRSTTGFGTTPLDKNRTSFVGELDFDMNIELSKCWSLNAGYQVLWVTRIAEALDQFFSPDAIFDDGNPILHGFRFGVTRTW